MTPEQIRATLPAYTDLMWPTVVVLREQGRSGTTQEINAAVVERMGLTEEQQSLQRERQHDRDLRAEAGSDAIESDIVDEDAESWVDEVIEALLKLTPDLFERVITRLLRETGCESVKVMGRASASDGGIDGLGIFCLSLVSFPVYFQAKRHSATVGASTVRDFRGAMAGRVIEASSSQLPRKRLPPSRRAPATVLPRSI